MSGAEAITAIQLVDACIGIANAIIDIGRAVHDAQGLPPKLRELLEKLPAIQQLLESAKESCEEGRTTDDAKKSAQPILEQCAEALAELRDIFSKACPKVGENHTKRIWRGAKTVFFGAGQPGAEASGDHSRRLETFGAEGNLCYWRQAGCI